MDTMFTLRLEQQPQGYYDLNKYVTLSIDNITYTSSIDLVDMIQWRLGLSIGEDLNFKGLHTDETLISYQMVK